MQGPEPDQDLALLVDAARAAGEIAKRFWRRDPEVWEKDAGAGPVTEADLAVNAMLEAELQAARPDYGWLSEESPDDTARLAAEHVFIVDPIDGTRAFIDGQDSFAHSLAVARDGVVTAGVVYLPLRDLLYTATIGGPALLNGEPMTGTVPRALEGAQVLTSAISQDPAHWRSGAAPAYRRVFRPSLAWRLCLVAEGRYDATISLRAAWEWDIAAGALIAERAGITVSDRNGQPIRYNDPKAQANGLLVAPGSLHADFVRALWPRPD